jgi:hypothetical protein
MARKTNYAFDRNNRAKAKAAKREAKRQAKLAAKAEKSGGLSAEQTAGDPSVEGEGTLDSQNNPPE